jgi:outer membrane protein assembly factor BamB
MPACRIVRTFLGPGTWAALSALAACLAAAGARAADDGTTWTRFRGPNGSGVSDLKGVPVQWTEKDYEWVRDLPGKGHSSPVIWKDRLFVGTGHEDGSRTLLCLNAITGEDVWSQTIKLGTNHLHLKNSYGSGTPAVDGERVYIAFGDGDHYVVTAYDLDGKQVWTTDLGSFKSQHGHGMSPIVFRDLLIVPNDMEGPSSIVALNRKTGKVVWTTTGRPHRDDSYSTPLVLEEEGRNPQIICISGAGGITGLDPETGRQLWASGELPLRTVASAVYGNGLVIASCGQGGIGKFMVAVDALGEGRSPGTVVHERDRELPYVPTPIIHDNRLYLWSDIGVAVCLDLKTFTEIWGPGRIGGKFTGSPIMIDGKIYCVSEAGEIVVIGTGPGFEVLGRSPLGDESYSTPAVANGRVYFRGFSKLACLKAKNG